MTGINLDLVRERAREIRENAPKVRRYAAMPDSEFFVGVKV